MIVKYKSYNVVNNMFNYIELVNGIEVSKQIPLYINNNINPLAYSIANEIKYLKDKVLNYKKKLINETPHMNFYHSIKNPLDNNEILSIIINSYDKDDKRGGLYQTLTHTYTNQKQFKGKIITSARDNVYASLFNKWKHNILRLDKENKFNIDSRYKTLANKLSNIEDIKTYKEYMRCLTDDFICDNCFNSIGMFSGWEHFASKYIEVGSSRRLNKLDHRLYINLEGFVLYDFINTFLMKCYEKKLPYYFKFDESCSRDDTFVLYSDTSHFLKYIEILNEIEKEYPEIIKFTGKPPILAGRINSYVGYGSEPDDGLHESFNEIREKILKNAMKNTVDEWLKKKINSGIRYNGRQISVVSLLAEVGSTQIYIYYKNLFDRYEKIGDLRCFYDYYGLMQRDFENSSFRLVIYEKIKKHIVNIINDPSYLSLYRDEILIKTRNNKGILIDESVINNIKMGIIKYIFADDKELITLLRKNIDILSEMEGIDINKFCFDKRIIDKFITQDKYLKKRKEIDKNFKN